MARLWPRCHQDLALLTFGPSSFLQPTWPHGRCPTNTRGYLRASLKWFFFHILESNVVTFTIQCWFLVYVSGMIGITERWGFSSVFYCYKLQEADHSVPSFPLLFLQWKLSLDLVFEMLQIIPTFLTYVIYCDIQQGSEFLGVGGMKSIMSELFP